MENLKQSTIKGFNELVGKIKETSQSYSDQEHYVSLVTFNCDGIKFRMFNQSVNELEFLDESLFEPKSIDLLVTENVTENQENSIENGI